MRLIAGSTTRILVALLLMSALVWLRWQGPAAGPSLDPPLASESETARVVRVVDGDTLIVAPDIRVRLIGIDTPELGRNGAPDEPLAREATAWLAEEVTGAEVRLEFDIERIDRYGRTLAFVWLGERLINAEIVAAGFSRAETQYPFSSQKKSQLKVAEEEARSATRGLWRAAPNSPATP